MPDNMRDMNIFFITSSGPVLAFFGLFISIFLLAHQKMMLILVVCLIVTIATRSMAEYFNHRYIWHRRTISIGKIKLRNPIADMHAQHHADPSSPDKVLFGWKAVGVGFVTVYLCGALLLSASAALFFVAIYAVLLLFYEWFHLLSHSQISPRSRYLREIIHRYRYHHYVDSKKCFGVSQFWLDQLCGTDMPKDGS